MAGEGFKIADGYLEIDADDSKGRRVVRRFLRDVNGRLHDERGRYVSEGVLAGGGYADGIERGADRRGRNFQFRGLMSRIGVLGGAAGKLFFNKFSAGGFLGAAAIPSTINAIAGALSGLGQISGALGALAPANILGLVSTVVALKLAFSGLGDVFKAGLSGDTAKFNEAMKQLGPSTQAAVKEILGLKDAARGLKREVQEGFFEPLVGQIKPLAQVYLPKVAELLSGISNSFGGAAKGISQWLRLPETVAKMTDLFGYLGQTAAYLNPILQNIVKSFLTLAQVGATFMPGLASGVAEITSTFAKWLETMAQTGGLQEFISGGLSLIGDLFFALKDVWGILRAINSAAPETGSVFGIIGMALRDLNEFLNSAAGQAGLSALLRGFQVLGQILKDLLVGIGPGLAVFLEGLLDGLKALAPVAKPVGEALGIILKALAPLLPLLGNVLAFGLQELATILSVIASELAPFIKLMSELGAAILPKVIPLFQKLAEGALPIIAEAATALVDAFTPLIPVLSELADQIINAILPYLPQWFDIMKQLVPVIAEVAKILAENMLKILEKVGPYLPQLVEFFAQLVILLAQCIPVAAQFAVIFANIVVFFTDLGLKVFDVLTWLADLPSKIGDAASAFWGWLEGVGTAISDWFSGVGQFFSELPGKIWAFLQTLPTLIGQVFQTAADRVFFSIGYLGGTLFKFLMELPGKISSFVSSIPGIISNAFSTAWSAALSATINGWNSVMAWFSRTAGQVWSFLSSIPSIVGNAFVSAWNTAKSATINGFNTVVGWIKGLPSTIKSIASGAGNWLYDAGRNVLQGLVNGAQSMVQSAINQITRALRNIVDGAKKALGIGSPSRVFAMEIGRWIPPGIQMGIDAKLPDLQRFLDVKLPQVAVAGAPGGMAPAAAPGGTRHYTVAIGDTPFVDLVLDAVTGAPLEVAAATDEGRRRRGFSYSARART